MDAPKEYVSPLLMSNKQFNAIQPKKKSNYTWIWIILAVIIVIVVIVIIYFLISSRSVTNTSILTNPSNISTIGPLYRVIETNPSSGGQTINPVGNTLYIFGPTATQSLTIGTSANSIGSVLGIRNASTTTNNNLIITAGAGITFIPAFPSGFTLAPGGYTELVLTRANTYTRLI